MRYIRYTNLILVGMVLLGILQGNNLLGLEDRTIQEQSRPLPDIRPLHVSSSDFDILTKMLTASNAPRPLDPDGILKILSIDGGGYRGYIPALVLKYLEKKVQVPLYKIFNIVSGASIGGIEALAVAAGFSADQITNFFENPQIVGKIFERYDKSVYGGLLGPKYDSNSFADVLKDYFGERTLADLYCEVFIPVLKYSSGEVTPIYYNSREHPNKLVWEVAFETAAAPYYFSLRRDSRDKSTVLDGGLFCFNSAYAGLKFYDPFYKHRKQASIISFGTGIYIRPEDWTDERVDIVDLSLGEIGIGKYPSLFNIVQAANAQAYEDACQRDEELQRKIRLKSGEVVPSYYRIQTFLRERFALDRHDKSTQEKLNQQSQELIQIKENELNQWDNLCKNRNNADHMFICKKEEELVTKR